MTMGEFPRSVSTETQPEELAAAEAGGLGERAAALAALQAGAEGHAEGRLSARTRRLYATDWAQFARWCQLAGLVACPAGVETVRWYLTDLERTRGENGAYTYAPATLRRRLAAIAAAHREAGHASPTRDPAVAAVLAGIERARAQPPRRLRPLLLADVRTMLAGLDYTSWPAGLAATRDAFVLLAGFAGALRRAELAALTVGDVTRHHADGLHVRIRASKTDQTAQGATIVLPYGQYPGTCPVCAYLRWTGLLNAARHGRSALMAAVLATPPWQAWTHTCGACGKQSKGVEQTASGEPAAAGQPAHGGPVGESMGESPGEGALPPDTPLLRAIKRGGHLSETAVSGDGLHAMVKRRAATAGLQPPVGFHSLRAGFVTQARRNEASYRAVRRQTRHGSDAMVEAYDREHIPLAGNAVTELGL